MFSSVLKQNMIFQFSLWLTEWSQKFKFMKWNNKGCTFTIKFVLLLRHTILSCLIAIYPTSHLVRTVQKIYKIGTVQKPDVSLPRHPTFNTVRNWKENYFFPKTCSRNIWMVPIWKFKRDWSRENFSSVELIQIKIPFILEMMTLLFHPYFKNRWCPL